MVWNFLPYYEFAEFNSMDLLESTDLPDIYSMESSFYSTEIYNLYGKSKSTVSTSNNGPSNSHTIDFSLWWFIDGP